MGAAGARPTSGRPSGRHRAQAGPLQERRLGGRVPGVEVRLAGREHGVEALAVEVAAAAAELEHAGDAHAVVVRADADLRLREVQRMPRARAGVRRGQAVAARADERHLHAERREQAGRPRPGGEDHALDALPCVARADAHAAALGHDLVDGHALADLDAVRPQPRREAVGEALRLHEAVDLGVHRADDARAAERRLHVDRGAGLELRRRALEAEAAQRAEEVDVRLEAVLRDRHQQQARLVHLELDAVGRVGVEQLERARVERDVRPRALLPALLRRRAAEAQEPAHEGRVRARRDGQRAAALDQRLHAVAHDPGPGERIGEARADPAGVAERRALPRPAAVEDDDVGPRAPQLVGAREADDARPDDDDPHRRQRSPQRRAGGAHAAAGGGAGGRRAVPSAPAPRSVPRRRGQRRERPEGVDRAPPGAAAPDPPGPPATLP